MVTESRAGHGRERSSGRAGLARILLVNEEPKLRRTLAEGLRLEGWQVDCADCGAEALRLLKTRYDLVVIDWMLPDCEGIELLQRVRAQEQLVPVLMIVDRDVHSDRAVALAHGASDCVTSPFAFADFLTRSRALLVPVPQDEKRVSRGEVELDLTTRILRFPGARIALTEIESALLAFLLRNADDTATTDMLSRQIWKEPVPSIAVHSALEMQMSLLMEKIASRSGVPIVQKVPGVGYTIDRAISRPPTRDSAN
jgi:DNA-binding response OmpR family regulator